MALIKEVGFPIVVALWLFWVHYSVMSRQEAILSDLRNAVGILNEILRNMVTRINSLEERVETLLHTHYVNKQNINKDGGK